ncbi:MAG: hypothetical protein HY368_00830 [Candidatus Aenigmarchaeota archaeon]|nr:hypothetical protein [Candidatus Aenigmarchaeota archaeon]
MVVKEFSEESPLNAQTASSLRLRCVHLSYLGRCTPMDIAVAGYLYNDMHGRGNNIEIVPLFRDDNLYLLDGIGTETNEEILAALQDFAVFLDFYKGTLRPRTVKH